MTQLRKFKMGSQQHEEFHSSTSRPFMSLLKSLLKHKNKSSTRQKSLRNNTEVCIPHQNCTHMKFCVCTDRKLIQPLPELVSGTDVFVLSSLQPYWLGSTDTYNEGLSLCAPVCPSVCLSLGPLLWSRLRYLNHY